MVDAIVSFAVERLGDFLIREAVFLHGVKDEVVWLRNELKWMQSFLKDTEQKQDSDERILMWVSEIRDIAYSSEDLIDTFILKVKGNGTTKRCSLSTLKKCFCISSTNADIYDIGKEIEVLRKRVLDVSRKREVYGIGNFGIAQEGTSGGTNGILRHLRRTASYADDEHLVGFEDDASLLEAKLLSGEQQRTVISILGMGGLGKTTLARKLYNNNDIKLMFDCHTWICVSQEWRIRDLLGRIIKSFKKLTKGEMEDMSDEDLERCLRELLEGHRYLVVIDDVWHREAWESLRRALPDNNNRSRVIITTRIEVMAQLSDHRTYVHRLRFLRPNESWELFCKKAFPDQNIAGGDAYDCPPDVEKLGEEMVAKCDGLPLAIIVLGGLLSRKQLHEWPIVKDHIWRELKNNSIHISSLLALSFNDLPHQLKPCFLYLGLYPKDFVFSAEKLVRLWVAEGFITKEDEMLELEEMVAEEYLNELIGRSMIQVVKRNWRMISTCRIHDLLRDLAVSKARELNFFHFYDEITNSAPSKTYRRLAFHSGIQSYNSAYHSYPHVRTLIFFNKDIYCVEQFVFTRFKLLRVLNLEGVQFLSEKLFPDALGKLIHLRYLGLHDTSIAALPESIGNLQALQTLDASLFKKTRLPREIFKLKQLRHLKGYFSVPPLFFEELTNLQSLKVVEIGGSINPEQGEQALNPIAKLRNLKFFSVKTRANILSIQPLLHCEHLLELRIHGSIKNLPEEMHKFLPNLKYLELINSGLEQDPMPTLEILPNLVVLRLSYIGVKTFTCTAKGFPKLQVLWITTLNARLRVQVEDGAMPRLRALSLDHSKKCLLPERLRSLPGVPQLNWEWERMPIRISGEYV